MNIREQLFAYVAKNLIKLHHSLRLENKEWNMKVEDFKKFQSGTLGNKLYQFYTENNFKPIAKLEYHDVYHILFNKDASVYSEIYLQFIEFGNGKTTFINYIVAFGSFLFFPEKYKDWNNAIKEGKELIPLFHIPFQHHLEQNFDQLVQSLYKENRIFIF